MKLSDRTQYRGRPHRMSIDFVRRKRDGSTVNEPENLRGMLGDDEMND